MRNIKIMMLGAVAILGFTSAAAVAGEQGYTSYNAEASGVSQSAALQNYFNYEEREPCQNYREPPAGFYREGCSLMRRAESVAEIEPAAGSPMAVYKINFGHDKVSIGPAEQRALDQIASEIKKYNPREVLVSGFADTSGPASYNAKLSQKRADSVAQALGDRGINTRVIDRQAYGESNLAVQTNDGVKLRKNRRAVIQFAK